MTTTDALTVLRALVPNGAVKSFARTASGRIAKTEYQKAKHWRASTVPINSFDEMAAALVTLVEDRSALVVRGALKPGLDLSQPIVRRSVPEEGKPATLEDVPRCWLHLDLDHLSAPHVDVIGDPSGAIDFALDAVATAAPELEGASCFAAFSSSAGVEDVTIAKLHLWFWLDRPYSNAELKRWAEAVNDRAGLKLIDLKVFNAAQPNYTARALFHFGAIDPLPGTRRWAIRRGYEETPRLVIPEFTRRAQGTTSGTASGSPIGGWVGYLNRINGEGLYGLRDPALKALASRISELGAARAELERDDIIATVAARLAEAPAGNRSAETVRGYIDDLPRLFDGWLGKWREQERTATEAEPTYPKIGVPMAEAEHAVADAIARFFKSIPGEARTEALLAALRVSTGIGKTQEALAALEQRPELRAAMLIPRHKLTDELLTRAAALGIDAAAWRGREALNPATNDGSLMCIEPEIHKAAKLAAMVEEACAVCPSRLRCPFQLDNKREPARLEIAANNFLFQRPPAVIVGDKNKIDVLIVDEAFLDRMTDEPRTLLLDALSTLPSAGVATQVDIDAARAPLRRALAAARAEGRLLKRHLTSEGIDADTCRRGEAGEWIAKPKAPKLVEDGCENLVATLTKYAGRFDNRPALLWRALGQFLAVAADDEAEAGAVDLLTATTDDGAAPAVRFRIRRELHEAWRNVPTLVLDAETLPSDAELEALFGRKPHRVEVSAEVPAAVMVHQLVDPLPISALVDRDGVAKPKLKDVADRIEVLARKYAGQGRDGIDLLAVGGTTAIADRLRELLTARGLDVAPKDGATRRHAVEVRHCGDLAGEDAYGGARAEVLVGWSLPPARALERDIGAATGLMPNRLPGEAWALEVAGLRLRDGTGYRVARPVHPDPAVEELRRRKTEGEAAQALGRARWTRRDQKRPLDLFILSPLPLPELVVDHPLRWGDVAVHRAELAFWRLGGVLPCRPADLVATGLWGTESAVVQDLKWVVALTGTILKGTTHFKITPARYRRPSQRRWSAAHVGAWLSPAEVVERLRRATGAADLIVEAGAPPPENSPEPAKSRAPEKQAGETGAPPPLPSITGNVSIALDAATVAACGTVATLPAGLASIGLEDEPDPWNDGDGPLSPDAMVDDPWNDDPDMLPGEALAAYLGGIMPEPVRDHVRWCWRASGLPQERIARLAGISRPQFANALQGRFGLSAHAASRLREAVAGLPAPSQARLL